MKRELARACPEAIVSSITPDVCLTPTPDGNMVPIGYYIRARMELAVGTNPKHLVDGYPVFTVASRIPTCEGNEAGTGGGVISGVNKGWCRPIEHSRTQRSGGHWVVRDGDLFAMNCNGPDGVGNCIGVLRIFLFTSGPPMTPISKSERTSIDPATGRVLMESIEVTRYPITGETIETRHRALIDPATGQVMSESIAVTTEPDGNRSYVRNVAEVDPATNYFAWKTTTGYVDEPPADEVEGPIELDEPSVLDGRSGGFYLQDESEVFRPYRPPGDEIPDDDSEVMNDPEVKAAQAEHAKIAAEIAEAEKQLAWETVRSGVDVAGIVDPTPACDVVGAGLALMDGDLAGAGMSVAGAFLPFVGDAVAKPLKASRAAARVAIIMNKLADLRLQMSKFGDAIRRAMDRVKGAIAKRRAGAGGGGSLPEPPAPKGPSDGSSVAKAVKKDYTLPSGKMGGKPRGKRADTKGSDDQPRGHMRQNEAADSLAAHGYDVEHNHDIRTGTMDKRPDYKIEGRYFDCYAPTVTKAEHQSKAMDKIRKKMSEKVHGGQTDRIVLNLDDTDVTPSDVQAILRRKPIGGLEEVIAIKNGSVQHIYP